MLSERDYQEEMQWVVGIGNLQDIYDALSKGSYRDSGIVKVMDLNIISLWNHRYMKLLQTMDH